MDNRTVQLYKNGTADGTAVNIPSGVEELFPAAASYGPYGTSSDPEIMLDFGQNGFKYTPPAGFKKLTVQNISYH